MTGFRSSAEEYRPIIGISASKPSSAGENYVKAVRNAGGIPMVITITEDQEELNRVLSVIDGLVMSGGPDVEPHRYGEQPVEELGIYIRKGMNSTLGLSVWQWKQDCPYWEYAEDARL